MPHHKAIRQDKPHIIDLQHCFGEPRVWNTESMGQVRSLAKTMHATALNEDNSHRVHKL